MGFETVVLDKVSQVLKSDNQASFFCGSLSVVCTAAEVNRIARKLTKELNTRVQISEDGSYGYVIDFVA
jgi:hypothetical protein